MKPISSYIRLRTKHYLLIGILVIGTIAGLTFFWERQQGIEKLHHRTEGLANYLGSDFAARTKTYAYLPKLIARYEVVLDALNHPSDPVRIREANALLKRVNVDAGTDSIFIMDINGLTIASSNWDEQHSFIGQNYGYRPYFSEAIRSGQGSFYALGALTGVPGYYISSLATKNSTPIGVVAVKTDLRGLLSNGWNNEDSEMLLEDENGIVFLSSRQEWMYRSMTRLDADVMNRLKNTRQYSNLLGEPLHIASREQLRPDEQIINIAQKKAGSNESELASYFSKSLALQNSSWKIHLLTSMGEVKKNAVRFTTLVVSSVLFLVLLLMYLRQAASRHREREESMREIELSHEALEQKNSDLLLMSEELRIRSITDSLTGSFNYRFFMESSAKMISAAHRYQYPLSIVMMDVDHFKHINDVHGHPAGDRVLQTLAAMYKEELREADIFARYGGEEFIMALAYTDDAEAVSVAERLRKKVMDHVMDIDGESLRMTVSTGIALLRPEDKDIATVIKRADQALYQAKEAGRNCVVISNGR